MARTSAPGTVSVRAAAYESLMPPLPLAYGSAPNLKKWTRAVGWFPRGSVEEAHYDDLEAVRPEVRTARSWRSDLSESCDEQFAGAGLVVPHQSPIELNCCERSGNAARRSSCGAKQQIHNPKENHENAIFSRNRDTFRMCRVCAKLITNGPKRGRRRFSSWSACHEESQLGSGSCRSFKASTADVCDA